MPHVKSCEFYFIEATILPGPASPGFFIGARKGNGFRIDIDLVNLQSDHWLFGQADFCITPPSPNQNTAAQEQASASRPHSGKAVKRPLLIE
jgi:hypothetical protein